MKNRTITFRVIVCSLFLVLGCGGDTEEDTATASAAGDETASPLGDDVELEAEAEPQVGDFVCEDADVFVIGNGGVKVFVKTCEEGLSCVPEAESGCACVPDCEGKTCGDDGCGGSCGTCDGELLCHTDGVCKDTCLPDGDGKLEGNHIQQMSWQTPPTGGFNLHDMCQSQDVIVIVEVAGW